MLKKPIKILQIINDVGMGGGEYYTLRLASILPKDKFEVICTCKKGQIFHRSLVAEGLRTFSVDLSQKGSPKTAIKIARFVRSHDIDILHAHGATGALYGRMVSVLTGKPLVTTYHVAITKITDIPNFQKLFYAYVDRILSSIDKRIIAVSKAVKKEMIDKIHFRPSRVDVIYTGLNNERYGRLTKTEARKELNLRNKGYYIGVIGRLSPEKGIHVLLEAMSVLVKDMPDAFLIVAGDGPVKGQLIAKTSFLGLMDRCKFLGYRPDIPDILPALDLLVLPSLTEGFPLILLEGMTAGIPIVASEVGGIPEIVRNKITGLLIPPNDHKSLAQAMQTVLIDSELSQRFVQAGRKIVESYFGSSQMSNNMGTIYERMIH